MTVLLWPLRALAFLAWFIGQVFKSNIMVIRDVLNYRDMSVPQVARYRTRCRTELEVAALSVCVSLTPGSIVLATEHVDGEWVVYVHDMYAPSKEAANATLALTERRLLSALRPRGGPDGPPADAAAARGEAAGATAGHLDELREENP